MYSWRATGPVRLWSADYARARPAAAESLGPRRSLVIAIAFHVMAGGTDWAVLAPTIIGAIGVGTVAGAVVTTYGGRGRERREVRSKALAELEQIEVTRRTLPLAEGTYYDLSTFAKFGTACMIAGVPRSIVATYDQICNASRRFTLTGSNSDRRPSFDAFMTSLWLGNEAAVLVRNALWHPRLMLLVRWWKVQRLRRKAKMLYTDFWQGSLTRATYRTWMKSERRSIKARRSAIRAANGALPGEVAMSSSTEKDGNVPGT